MFWAACTVGLTTTEVDNFPNVVLESIAAGTPFVAPSVGGSGELISRSGGGLVVERTADQLTEALVEVLKWGERRLGRMKRALDYVSQTSSEPIVAESYHHVYRHALECAE